MGEDVHVQENSDGIHSGKDKKLYIELLINDEDRFVLMPEGTDYEIKLAPDESITLEFTGEMNENTSQNWQDSDVKISPLHRQFQSVSVSLTCRQYFL